MSQASQATHQPVRLDHAASEKSQQSFTNEAKRSLKTKGEDFSTGVKAKRLLINKVVTHFDGGARLVGAIGVEMLVPEGHSPVLSRPFGTVHVAREAAFDSAKAARRFDFHERSRNAVYNEQLPFCGIR